MTLPIWEYKIFDCVAKITDSGGLFRDQERYWISNTDGELMGLQEGLEKLGNKVWELAGIQTV